MDPNKTLYLMSAANQNAQMNMRPNQELLIPRSSGHPSNVLSEQEKGILKQ